MTSFACTFADSATMLRRNLKHQLRYPSLTLMLAGFPIVFLLREDWRSKIADTPHETSLKVEDWRNGPRRSAEPIRRQPFGIILGPLDDLDAATTHYGIAKVIRYLMPTWLSVFRCVGLI